MILSTAQLQVLKADINANAATFGPAIARRDWVVISAFYNANAAPAWTVWKSLVALDAVGLAINFIELAGLSTLDTTRLQTIFQISPRGINAYLTDRRTAFDNIFSAAGGAITRPQLLVLWKRLALVGEKLFSTGTGSDAAPATLAFTVTPSLTTFAEGLITEQNVLNALDL